MLGAAEGLSWDGLKLSALSPLGDERITNSAFAGNADGWTLGSGWAYNTDKITFSGVGDASAVTDDETVVQSGKFYRLQVAAAGDGHLTINSGGNYVAELNFPAGTYTFTFRATWTGGIELAATTVNAHGYGRFSGDVSLVSVQEIPQTLETGYARFGGPVYIGDPVADFTFFGQDVGLNSLLNLSRVVTSDGSTFLMTMIGELHTLGAPSAALIGEYRALTMYAGDHPENVFVQHSLAQTYWETGDGIGHTGYEVYFEVDSADSTIVANRLFRADASYVNTGSVLQTDFGFFAEDRHLYSAATEIQHAYGFWYDGPGVWYVDAAGLLALHNPDITKFHPTFTDYERGVLRWNSNVFEVGAQQAGGGTLRGLRLLHDELYVDHDALPTSDPTVKGQLYQVAGALKVSAGA